MLLNIFKIKKNNGNKIFELKSFFWVLIENPQVGHFQKIKINKKMKKVIFLIIVMFCPKALESATDCLKLRVGQFICPDPDSAYDYIDKNTQSVIGCSKEGTAKVRCIASEGIICEDSSNNTFYSSIPCEYT